MTSVQFDIPVQDDNILEGNESFTIMITNGLLPEGVSAKHGDHDQAYVTIVDTTSKSLTVL